MQGSDWREVRACELNCALGGDPSCEVLKRGGVPLVVTEVVPDGPDQKKKKKKGGGGGGKEFLCCSVFDWMRD